MSKLKGLSKSLEETVINQRKQQETKLHKEEDMMTDHNEGGGTVYRHWYKADRNVNSKRRKRRKR